MSENRVAKVNPKVSIIVPVYNTETTLLLKCINSLKNQSYENIECYFIDDGSNEQTKTLLDTECNFRTAHVVHGKWGGYRMQEILLCN